MITRTIVLLVTVAFGVEGSWLGVESLTNRPDRVDQTCASNSRAVVCDFSNRVHVVWRGHVGNVFQVWYMCSPGDTVRWRDTTLISTDTAPATDPCLALDSAGNIHVAWTSGDSLRLATRERLSGVWTAHTPFPVFRGDSSVSMACDAAGRRHLVWLRGGGTAACVCYVGHDATGWHDHDTVGVAQSNTGLGRPSIAAAGNGDLMVVWKDQFLEPAILARIRFNEHWQEPETVCKTVPCQNPCVARSVDSLWHVVWASPTNPVPRVLWRFRRVEGWSRDTCVASVRNDALSPSLTADGDGDLHFVWAGEPYSGADQLVFYRRRSRVGAWTDPETLSHGRATYRRRLSVSAGRMARQVIWSEWENAHGPPAVRLRRYVAQHDVGIDGLFVPRDTVDSGMVLAGMAAAVRNNGDFPESTVTVLLKAYRFRSTRVLSYLDTGVVDTVEFDNWLAGVRGWNVFVCSAGVALDCDSSNDMRCDSVFVRVRDGAVERIVSPDTLVTTDTVVPEVALRNCGNVSAAIDCHVWITGVGVSYYQQRRDSIVPDSMKLLVFPPCEVGVGYFVVRCSLACNGDLRATNDTASRMFRVVRRDVGAAGIVRPTGRVDSGSTIVPCATVANYGSATESFHVVLRIGQMYTDTTFVYSLPPGRVWPVEFDEWHASEVGIVTICCSTMLAGDRRANNNALRSSVFVRVVDASVKEIVYPRERIGLGDVCPLVSVVNLGNESLSVPVHVVIDNDSGRLFSDSLLVAILPDEDTIVEFSAWHVRRGGDYCCTARVTLAGDMRPNNDVDVCRFHVVKFDAAVLGVRQPAETVLAGSIEPEIIVKNQSEEVCDIKVTMRILREDTLVYLDSMLCLAMRSGDTVLVQLRPWWANTGRYRVQAWVFAAQDSIHENDSISFMVIVDSARSAAWRELAPLPAGPRGAAVGAGGSIAVLDGSMFVLKGGGSSEFYRYELRSDSWYVLRAVPRGVSGRGVKGGGALASDGNCCLFALKGCRTREFWRYAVEADSWTAVASLPNGLPPARFGSGLAYVHQRDTAKVFCVKGGGTLDFLVYWVPYDQWHARRSIPLGPGGKKARRGTAIVDVGGRVFVLKGGTNEFYEYRPRTDDWIARAEVPVTGRSGHFRRCRDGAALTSDGSRFVYALKGGCCNEFWRYDVLKDSWRQLEDVPAGNEIEWIRAGAALAYLNGKVYCLKGRGTRTFWCYNCTIPGVPVVPERAGVAAGERESGMSFWLSSVSRVLRVGTCVSLGSGVVVQDVSGRVLVMGSGRLRFERPGVFFFKMDRTNRAAYKLVVVR